MSSISSQVLAASPSGLNGQECGPSPYVKSSPIAEPSSESTGPTCPSARTSGQWRLTEQQKRQATALYEGGLSLGRVAAQFGVTRQSMWDVLRRRTQMRDRLAALPRKDPNAIRLKRLAALRRYRSRAARITAAQVQAVKDRDRVCCACKKAATDIDHIIPVSRGGQTELSNLQLLCRPCHHQKSRADRKEV